MPLFHLPVFWFGYFDGFKTLSNITNINQVILSQIPIIIPPVEVQLKAIRKVEKMLAAIDKLIKGKQEIISSLERYKKSLIYEVVTGKKEV